MSIEHVNDVRELLVSQLKSETGMTDFDESQSLLSLGINSIEVMHIISYWIKNGYKVSFSKLIREPYVDKWAEIIFHSKKKTREAKSCPAAVKVNMYEPFPLTDVQYAYWAGRNKNQYLGGVGCHGYFEVDCHELNMERLGKAWKVLFAYHPMLRAKYTPDGRQMVMEVPYSDQIKENDFRGMSEEETRKKLLEIRNTSSHRLLKIEEGEVIVLQVSHLDGGITRMHFEIDLLVCDVQSFQIILKDLAAYYMREKTPDVEKEWNFAQYLHDEKLRRKQDYENARKYWEGRMEVLPDSPKLPLLRKSATEEHLKFHRHAYHLPRKQLDVIQDRCKEYHVTPAVALLTAYGLTISKWSDNKKFLMNMPLFNRNASAGIDNVVADFTNLLLVDMDFGEKKCFAGYLADVNQRFLETMDNSAYSGIEILRGLRKERGTTVTAPIVFSCNLGKPLVNAEFKEAFGDIEYMISQTPQVLLDFQVFTAEDGYTFIWDAADDMFQQGLVDEMFECFVDGVNLLADPETSWESIDGFVSASQKAHRQAAAEFTFPYDKSRTMTEGIFCYAKETPDAAALIDPVSGQVMTYEELAEQVSYLAGYLQSMGLAKDDKVAVVLPRGIKCVLGEVGVVAGGAVYVPISVHQPRERMEGILASADCRCILCSEEHPVESFGDIPSVYIEDCIKAAKPASEVELTGEESAYIIFTSGSTGKPKGVEITHCAAMNTIDTVNEEYHITSADRAIGVSSNDFDLSVYDIFGMLNVGGSLVVVPDSIRRDAHTWTSIVNQYGVTLWNSVPTLMKMLLADAENDRIKFPSLKTVLLSGDWIGLELPGKLQHTAPDAALISLGGATEAAIWSNHFPVNVPLPKEWVSIPYGAPLKHQFYRVVDENGMDCPDYVAGELWIGGAGVAVGYTGDKELTEKKFVYDLGARWYRTGDNGRFWHDGTIEFLGRQDNQIKIRGHRIELGEIESAIREYPGIEQAVTCVKQLADSKQLVSFVVCDREQEGQLAEGLFVERKAPFTLEALTGAAAANYDAGSEKALMEACEQVYRKGLEKILGTLEGKQILEQYQETVAGWKAQAAQYSAEAAQMNAEHSTEGKEISEEWSFLEGFTDLFTEKAADILCGAMNSNELLLDERFVAPNILVNKMPRGKYLNDILTRFIRNGADHCTGKLKVLEVGVRDAESTLQFVTAADTEYTVLDKFRFFMQQAETVLGDRVQYITADLNDTTEDMLSGSCFDIIMLNNTLHQFLHTGEVVKYLSSHLSVGGILVFAEMIQDFPLQNITSFLLREDYTDARKSTDRMLFTETEWEEILEQCDLERIPFLAGEDTYQTLFAVQNQTHNSNNTYFAGERVAQFLEDKIPEYMIPARIIAVEAFPLTGNGKVDRKRLVARYGQDMSSEQVQSTEEIFTPTERKLREIWSKVLNAEVHKNSHYFRLGGDSLLATVLSGDIRKTFGVAFSLEKIFQYPVFQHMAECIDAAMQEPVLAEADLPELLTDPENRYAPFPLTDVQQAYWIGRTDLFNYSNVSTHCYFEMDCPDIDIALAEEIWNRLIETHDMLRGVMLPNGESQMVLEKVDYYKIECFSFDGCDESTEREHLVRIRSELSSKNYDMTVYPLFDIKAAKLQNGTTRLFISFDNIVLDGWSMFYLFREWKFHYYNPTRPVAQEKVTFRDYVRSYEQLKKSDAYEKDMEYWKNKIDAIAPAPEFHIKSDRLNSANRFVRFTRKLEASVWESIKEKLQNYSITPSVFLMAAYAEVIALWSKSQRFSINLTRFSRVKFSEEIDRTVGDFTSLTITTIDASAGKTFAERVQAVQKSLWEDLNHPLVSGVTVERMLNQANGSGSMPVVFTSGLGLEQGMDAEYQGYLGNINYGLSQTPQVWLDHQVYEEEGGLSLSWDALIDIFPENMVGEMFECYIDMLYRLARDLELWNRQTGNILSAPNEALRAALNDTQLALSADTLIGLYEKALKQYPDKLAVESEEKCLTYRELDGIASYMAEQMSGSLAGRGDVVGILMEKGWQQIAGIIAVMKAGAAYLPLNISNPYQRNQEILERAGAKLLLVQQDAEDLVDMYGQDITVLKISETYSTISVTSPAEPDDMAYIIYTSGTTGRPKGVAINHRGAVNTILDVNRRIQATSADKTIAISDLGFDLSVYDIFGMFACGGSIVIPAQSKVKEPSGWLALVEHYGVTIWNTVPMFMQMFLSYLEYQKAADTGSLRCILLSGDWIPLTIRKDVDTFIGSCDVYGLGGATEASIWSNIFTIDRTEPDWKSIPYGKPLANQRYYIFNDLMQDCPNNVIGNLYIGGDGLAMEYWKDPENTSASFITHPSTGERLYRTGDTALYRPDGNIEFCGRDDGQVKINGFRIELEEINKQMQRNPAIRQAESVVYNNDIYAFAVAASEVEAEELLEQLKAVLPEYMVPREIFFTDAIPLTQNGKVNRKQLCANIQQYGAAEYEEEVLSEREAEIHALWVKILELDKIRLNDEFIRTGGSSLSAVKLINLINNEYAIGMTIRDFYQNSTIKKMAVFIDECLGDEETGDI